MDEAIMSAKANGGYCTFEMGDYTIGIYLARFQMRDAGDIPPLVVQKNRMVWRHGELQPKT